MVLTLTRLNGSVNGHLNWDMEENGALDLKLLQLNPQDKWLTAHVLVDLHLLISPNIPCSLSNTHTHTNMHTHTHTLTHALTHSRVTVLTAEDNGSLT